MDAALVLACPVCAQDIPAPDLARFVRFYNGDEGVEECQCGAVILWRMEMHVVIDRMNSTTVA